LKKIWAKILLENPHLEKWDTWLRRFTLPGLDGVPVSRILEFFLNEMKTNSISTRSKSIAYSFFLSLFPALVFVFTLVPYFLSMINFTDLDVYLLGLIKDVCPSDELYKFLKTFLEPLIRD